jgi:hypothetical protein
MNDAVNPGDPVCGPLCVCGVLPPFCSGGTGGGGSGGSASADAGTD